MDSTIPSTRVLETVAKEFLAKLPGHLPMPHFEIKSDYHSKWLGKCEWTPGQENTTIYIQKSIFSDKETLRRTVAHELCHHCDYLMNKLPEFKKNPEAFAISDAHTDGHGTSFHKIAATLNSVFGKGFIVDKSDMAMNLDHVPEYSILLMKDKSGRIYWSVAPHPNEEQRKHITDMLTAKMDQRDYKLTTSTDPLLFKGTHIGSGFSTPKKGKSPINTALVERLVDLWKHGKAASLPHEAHASEDDLFVPRNRVTSIFSGGSVFYAHSSYNPEFVAVANMDKFNAVAGPIAKRDSSIARPVMAARIETKLPRNLKMTFPGQLHGIIEMQFDVVGSDVAFIVYADHLSNVGIDIMEGSNRQQLATGAVRGLWDAPSVTAVFSMIFSFVRKHMIEAMQDRELKVEL